MPDVGWLDVLVLAAVFMAGGAAGGVFVYIANRYEARWTPYRHTVDLTVGDLLMLFRDGGTLMHTRQREDQLMHIVDLQLGEGLDFVAARAALHRAEQDAIRQQG